MLNNRSSALYLSLLYGHLDAARLLIASGSNLDYLFFNGLTGFIDNYKKVDNYCAKAIFLFDLAVLLKKEKDDIWSVKVSSFDASTDDNTFKNLFLKISGGLCFNSKFKIISELIKSKDINKLIQISGLGIIYWRYIEKQLQDPKNLSLSNIAPLLDFCQFPLICRESKSIFEQGVFRNGENFAFKIYEFATLFFANNPSAKSDPNKLKKTGHVCEKECKCALSIYNNATAKRVSADQKNLSYDSKDKDGDNKKNNKRNRVEY